jgi:hypothetical protein
MEQVRESGLVVQTHRPVREAATQTEARIEFLQERLTELEVALENAGWQLLTTASDREFSREGLRTISRLARVMWLKNPLIKRGVQVHAHYVMGQAVQVHAQDAEVNEVLQRFWDDPQNQAELTSQQALEIKETELQLVANLFFVFFTKPDTGRVRVRTIPLDEIADILANPEDSKDIWFYKRTWTQVALDGKQETLTRYYPDWRYQPEAKPQMDAPIEWATPVYHVAVNKLSDMRLGVSEVYAAIDWARAYKEFLEDWATLTRAYSRFAHKLTMPGGKAAVQAAKAKLGTTLTYDQAYDTNPPPTVGSTFIAGQGVNLEPVKIGGANVSAEDGRRLLLMVSAALGLPESFFGDVSVGTLATAKSLDRPTELAFIARRSLWSDVLGAILNYVIVQAVKAKTLAAKLETDEDGAILAVTLPPQVNEETGEEEERDATPLVEFPSILEHDVQAQIGAIVDAATLKGSQPAGTIPDMKVLARMLLTALDVDDVDALIALLFPPGAETDLPAADTGETDSGEIDPETGEPTEGEPDPEGQMAAAVREMREALRVFQESQRG